MSRMTGRKKLVAKRNLKKLVSEAVHNFQQKLEACGTTGGDNETSPAVEQVQGTLESTQRQYEAISKIQQSPRYTKI